MRRVTPLVTITLLVGACRSEPAPTCDLDALARLGDRLAPLSISEQASQVWPALVDACDGTIPTSLKNYFEPIHDPELRRPYLMRARSPWAAALQRSACPDWDELARAEQIPSWSERSATVTYELCEFARYGVFKTDEVVGFSPAIMTWATHAWLLDRGLDGHTAAPITRALFALEQLNGSPIERYEDLRLPRVHGVRFSPGAAAYVARDSIIVESRQSVALVDGHFTDETRGGWALAEDLHELADRSEHGTFALVADAQTPMATIERLLRIVDHAGFAGYGLVVEPEIYVPTWVPVTVVRVEPNVARDESIFMRIELAPESVTLSRFGVGGHQPEAYELTQLDAVYRYAQAIRGDDPEAHRVVVSADGAVLLEQALAVIDAARGPECADTGAGCVLPEVLLLHSGHD